MVFKTDLCQILLAFKKIALMLIFGWGNCRWSLPCDCEVFDRFCKHVIRGDALAFACFNSLVCQLIGLLSILVDESQCFLILLVLFSLAFLRTHGLWRGSTHQCCRHLLVWIIIEPLTKSLFYIDLKWFYLIQYSAPRLTIYLIKINIKSIPMGFWGFGVLGFWA